MEIVYNFIKQRIENNLREPPCTLKNHTPRRDLLSEWDLIWFKNQYDMDKRNLSSHSGYDPHWLTDLALKNANFKFILGEPDSIWKKWLTYCSLGYFIDSEYYFARIYAALADEDEFLKIIPPPDHTELQVEDFPAMILTGCDFSPDDFKSLLPRNKYDNAVLSLVSSIPRGDNAEIMAALEVVKEDWIEFGGEYLRSASLSIYPQFELQLCLPFQKAYRNGFDPQTLSKELYTILEAGFTEHKAELILTKDLLHDLKLVP